MDYAMLSRYSIQSTSDQEDYLHYSTIACNAPSAVTMEQAAVWSYPMRDADAETTAFNMVNAMIGRIHQSGHLTELNREARALVDEGIKVYKTMRQNIRLSVPAWPLGFAHSSDPCAALMLLSENGAYLAVWSRSGDGTCVIKDLDRVCGHPVRDVSVLYPSGLPTDYSLDGQTLRIRFPVPVCARIFSVMF